MLRATAAISAFPRCIIRGLATAKKPRIEPKDLHASWAALAAYDSEAAGKFLNKEAEKAKVELHAAGYEIVRSFIVDSGRAIGFDGKSEVDETDAAYLWHRADDRRSILAFRGSDTQQDLKNNESSRHFTMRQRDRGHELHAGVAEGELAPLVATMAKEDFADSATLAVTGHSLGGGCASLFAVLMNDKNDPLGLGATRKRVDELYGFGATPVFHNDSVDTPNAYGSGGSGSFPGAIFRAMRTIDGVEVQARASAVVWRYYNFPDQLYALCMRQDLALKLTTHQFHHPKTHLVTLRSDSPPLAHQSSTVKGTPGWRLMVRNTPLDSDLFPLHNPTNYVRWLGTQETKFSMTKG